MLIFCVEKFPISSHPVPFNTPFPPATIGDLKKITLPNAVPHPVPPVSVPRKQQNIRTPDKETKAKMVRLRRYPSCKNALSQKQSPWLNQNLKRYSSRFLFCRRFFLDASEVASAGDEDVDGGDI